MAHVAIEKIKGDGPQSQSLAGKLGTLAERVRQRAYEIFEQRGTDGREIEDWLQAERDLVFAPELELLEKGNKYEIRVAVPGFKASETKVTVLPDALIVSAEATHKHESKDAEVRLCEFGSKTLYRRVDLPKPIAVDKVTASLDDGMLHITAQKSETAVAAAKAAA